MEGSVGGGEMARRRRKGRGVRRLGHYSSAQSILVVGDGDMSFSLALAAALRSGDKLVASSLDSYDALTSKYGKAESNVTELERLGATVLHGVDAKTMKHLPCLKMRQFDRIVFNFPHAGFTGHENEHHMINAHRFLVMRFFSNASQLLCPDGEIHVSHKTGQPYDRWEIKELASEFSLVMFEMVAFRKEDYPGYNQKRGDGERCDEKFPLHNGWTSKFYIEYEEAEECAQKDTFSTAAERESQHKLQESLDHVTNLNKEKEQQLLLLRQELISISESLRSSENARSTLGRRLEEEQRRNRKFTAEQKERMHRLQQCLDVVTNLHQDKEQQLLLLRQELISIIVSLRSCGHARNTLGSTLEEEQRGNSKITAAQRESLLRLRESLDAVITNLHQDKEQELLLLRRELISISKSLRSCENARSTLESRLEEEQRRSRKFKLLFWFMFLFWLAKMY